MKYFFVITIIVLSSCNGLFQKNNKRYILEVDSRKIILQMAAENKVDESFKKILFKTDSLKAFQRDKSYSELFLQVLSVSKDISLKDIFVNDSNKLQLDKNADNSKVISVIESNIDSTIQQMSELISERIEAANISGALVEPIKGTSFIKVEAYVKNSDQILDLITANGDFKFLDVYNTVEISQAFLAYDKYLLEKYPHKIKVVKVAIAEPDNLDALLPENNPRVVEEIREDKIEKDTVKEIVLTHSDIVLLNKDDRSFQYLLKDKSHIFSLLNSPEAKTFFPENLRFVWGKIGNYKDTVVELVPVKLPGKNDIILTGADITKASVNKGQMGDYEVNFTFNEEKAKDWKEMTRIASMNGGRRIAMVLDNVCISAPTVRGEIQGGNSSISGDFTLEQVENIVTFMKSKAYPVGIFLNKEEAIE